MIRILIADDHAVARRGTKDILKEAFPNADIHLAGDAETVISILAKHQWSLIICDISMPGRSGMDVLLEINRSYPNTPVLMLTVHPEEEYAVRAIKSGAAGYLNKDYAAEDELVKAVNTILEGRKYINTAVAQRLADEMAQSTGREPHEILSDKEFQIFKLIASGRSTGEIARQLSLSVNTIGTFRSRILAKMQLHNTAEIVTYAIRRNLL